MAMHRTPRAAVSGNRVNNEPDTDFTTDETKSLSQRRRLPPVRFSATARTSGRAFRKCGLRRRNRPDAGPDVRPMHPAGTLALHKTPGAAAWVEQADSEFVEEDGDEEGRCNDDGKDKAEHLAQCQRLPPVRLETAARTAGRAFGKCGLRSRRRAFPNATSKPNHAIRKISGTARDAKGIGGIGNPFSFPNYDSRD